MSLYYPNNEEQRILSDALRKSNELIDEGLRPMTESLKRWEFDYEGSYFLDDEGEWVRYDDANKRISELVQQCEKLREERNTVRVKVEQPLLLRIRELELALEFIRKETLAPNDRLYLHDIANNALKEQTVD